MFKKKLQKLPFHMFLVLIPIHALVVYLFLSSEISILYFILTSLCMWVLIGGIGVELGFHRIIAHRQFMVTKKVEKLIALIGCLGLNGSPTFWRAMHVGYHHPYSDTPRDFHSSVGKTKLHSYFLYINNLWKVKYVCCREYVEDKFFVTVDRYYILIVWLTIAIALLCSPFIALCLTTAMILSYHQTAIVNTLCHDTNLGYATHKTNDRSRNIKWLTWVTFGQSLHNNHHKFPCKANNAHSPGEIDIGYFLAKIVGFKVRPLPETYSGKK